MMIQIKFMTDSSVKLDVRDAVRGGFYLYIYTKYTYLTWIFWRFLKKVDN